MKKSNIITSLFIISIIVVFFTGCVKINSDEKLLIYYNDKYYNSAISNDYTYNSFWYPLSEADVIDTAFVCSKNDDINKLGKNDEVEIKKFSDESLNMFISHTDFWDEWLYCDTNFQFPSLSPDNIESISLKRFSEEKEWIDYYNSDNCIIIHNQKDIDSIINHINNIKTSSKNQSYNMNEVNNQSEICIKFYGINALYYLGIIAFADNNVVFYNAHEQQSNFNVLYEQCSSNQFDILKSN